ncbi:MAG: hypothetical protein RIG66_22465 [Coleofasciculus sp. E2-BRE-01]
MASSIEFKLFAPYNKSAVLKGCFSDWQEIQMEKEEDGYFRTSVELEDGTYQYKFRVQSKSWFLEPDQWVDVTDPYATGVIDDETQNGVMRIKDGQRIVDTYTWQHDDTPLPQNHELVIYEMHIGDFSGGEDDSYPRGQFKHVVEKYALYGDNIDFFYEDPEAKVLGYIRWNDEGSQLIIIANFSDNFLEGYAVSQIPESGTWHEWTRDYDVEVVEGTLELDLGEYEAKVLVWQ